jgi:single-stranded-DNA-specific exonuclease
VIYSDGELQEADLTIEFTELLQQAAIWGQGFPEPMFDGVFDVVQCRIVGGQHLKFVLRLPFSSLLIDAIAFFADRAENWLGCRKILAVYKLDINEYRGQRSLQLQIHYLEKLG